MSGDILTRSTAHWSEAGRAGMDAFYTLATDDYRHLAEARDWAAWLQAAQDRAGDRSLRLLDVACGSGKFPNALVRHAGVAAAGLRPVATDLLDPSAFSIAEARAALPAPFMPAAEHETTLQDFTPPPDGYDIVWATHALYAVPAKDLPLAAERFCEAVGPIRARRDRPQRGRRALRGVSPPVSRRVRRGGCRALHLRRRSCGGPARGGCAGRGDRGAL